MEETNIQPVQAEQPKGRYKIGIIASIVIAVIVLLFIARIMISNSTTNKASDMVQTFLFSQIGNSISGQSKINLTSLDEVQSKLNSDETFVSSQLNELKSSGKILASVPNRTMVCGDGTIIGPEGAYNGAQCNFSTGQVASSGSGYVSVNSNGSKAVIEVWRYSSLLTIEKYSSYVLQLNNEEPKNLENIFAQTLDEILYLAELVIDQTSFINSFRKSPINNITDAGIVLSKLEAINSNLELPTAEEINSLDLKTGCINSFSELNKNEQLIKTSIKGKIFFLGPSQAGICAKLDEYHKKNALKILAEAQTTQNPIIAIESKLHLNILVKCSAEIFPTKDNAHTCRDDYIKQFEAKFSSA